MFEKSITLPYTLELSTVKVWQHFAHSHDEYWTCLNSEGRLNMNTIIAFWMRRALKKWPCISFPFSFSSFIIHASFYFSFFSWKDEKVIHLSWSEVGCGLKSEGGYGGWTTTWLYSSSSTEVGNSFFFSKTLFNNELPVFLYSCIIRTNYCSNQRQYVKLQMHWLESKLQRRRDTPTRMHQWHHPLLASDLTETMIL